MTINELAAEIQTGNDTEPVLTELYQHVRRVTMFQNLPVEDKEDIIHDVYMILVEVIKAGHAENAEAYMRRTIHNKTATQIVKRQRTRRQHLSISATIPANFEEAINLGELLPDKTPLVSEVLVEKEQREQLRGLIERLPARFRTVAKVSFIDELTPREAQKRLGLTPTQYRLNKSRGKHTLISIAKDKQKKREKTEVWKINHSAPFLTNAA